MTTPEPTDVDQVNAAAEYVLKHWPLDSHPNIAKACHAFYAGITWERARAALAAREPLTDAEIDHLWLTRHDLHGGDLMLQLRDYTRAVEYRLGITPKEA